MNESPPTDEDGFEAQFYSLLNDSAIRHRVQHWIVHFYKERETALRGPIPRSVPAHEFFKHHNQLYENRCETLLTRGRSALHKAVDRLADTFYTQAVTDGGAALSVDWEDEKDEPTATPGTNGRRGKAADAAAAASRLSTNLAKPSSARESQWATGDAVSGFTAVNGTTRSSRGWPLERESSPVAASPAGGLRTRLPSSSTAKRRASSRDSPEERPKRTRRTSYSRPRRHAATSPTSRTPSRPIRDELGNLWPNQSPILLRDVKMGECVFQYPDAVPGRFFVLRCNRRQCKPNREQMATVDGVLVFTAYPFRYKRAEKHFSGSGHHYDSDTQIFSAFAREVADAVTELNIETVRRGKGQQRQSTGAPTKKHTTDTVETTATAAAEAPSSRSRRAYAARTSVSASPRHPRRQAPVESADSNARSQSTSALSSIPGPSPARSRSHSSTRSQRRTPSPPHDPSLLMRFVEVDGDMGNNNSAGEERGFTRAGFVAPEDDVLETPNDDNALESIYAPSSADPSSLERDAAAALSAVNSHKQQRADAATAAGADADADAESPAADAGGTAVAYPTRARVSLRAEAPEDPDQAT